VLNDINIPTKKGRMLNFAISSILRVAVWVDYKANCGLDYLPLWIIIPKPVPVREREMDIKRVDLEKFIKFYGKFMAIEGIILEIKAREF